MNVRRLKAADEKPFFDMQGNLNVMRYIKKTMNFEESKKELNRFIGYYDDKKIYFKIWALEDAETAEFVGICGVYKNEKSEFEIAYRLRECFWGKGFGKEVAQGLIKHCFEKIKIEELTAYVIIGNIGSLKILESEMNFVEEFFCKKTNTTERKFQLKK
ncbi:MAG: GNAT family N-acetyltransferase [Saprospiraceae bacterium]